jgi:hypothetical protein
MNTWIMNGGFALFVLLASTGLFFFVVTRGALLVRGLSPSTMSEKSHVYPIYSNMGLIKMVDFQPASRPFCCSSTIAGIEKSLPACGNRSA